MPRSVILLFFLSLISTSAQAQRWELQWAEEFDGPEIDRDTWTFWEGRAFNNELQYYTDRPENHFIEDGVLHLVGRTEDYRGADYTSARIRSKNASDWKYGRFEIRAKVPERQGLWPAIWMLPTDNFLGPWPYSGEIDIMEYRGNEPDNVLGTVHYACCPYTGDGSNVADRRLISADYTLPSGTFADDFYVYTLEWTADSLEWFVDDVRFATVAREEVNAPFYPFQYRFFFILNLAIGGDFLPDPIPGVEFEEALQIDYIRVYQDANVAPTASIRTDAGGTIEPGSAVTFEVEAADTDGEVTEVAIRFNGEEVIRLDAPPYAYTWPTAIVGCHEVTARAFDNDGGITDAEPLAVTVGGGCTQQGFNGTPTALPATIRLADYDRGGQGVAYNDATPLENSGAADGDGYRPFEGVDTARLPDDTPVVVADEAEEWMEYTVTSEEGPYDLTLRIVEDDNDARLRLDRLSRTGEATFLGRFLRFPGDADGTTVKAITLSDVAMTAGTYRLRLTAEQPGARLIDFGVATTVDTRQDAAAPRQATLRPLAPNPLRNIATVRFDLAEPGPVSFSVLDVLGRRVLDLRERRLGPGAHALSQDFEGLPPGSYILRMTTPTAVLTQPFVIAR